VSVHKLSEKDLSGAEIKNVVLNAARIALARDPKGQLLMSDFMEAIRMEVQNRWTDAGGDKIGFRRDV